MRSSLTQCREIINEATEPYVSAGLTIVERRTTNGVTIFDLSFRGTNETVAHRPGSSSSHFVPQKVRKDIHAALNRLGCLSAPVVLPTQKIRRPSPRATFGDIMRETTIKQRMDAAAPPKAGGSQTTPTTTQTKAAQTP